LLRNNQLHWFDPPDPDSKKVSSEDAVILDEPVAIQGASQHAPSGHCVSVVTLAERYFFVGVSAQDTQAWTHALQVVWHCVRAEYPGGIDLQCLESMVTHYKEAIRTSGTHAQIDGAEELMQWRTTRSKAWRLVAAMFRESVLQLYDPPKEPGAAENLVASIPVDAQMTVTELTQGLFGFELTALGENHAFAVHDADAAARWVLVVGTAVNASPPEGAAASGASVQAKLSQVNEVNKMDGLDDLDDLDELDDLDIPSTGGQLDDLAELEELDDLELTNVASTSKSSSKSMAMQTYEAEAPAMPVPIQILQGKLERRSQGKLAKWKTGLFVLDTEELSWYDAADVKQGACLTKSLKTVRMLDGQAEGSMVGFTLNLAKSGENITLRARTQREAGMWVQALSDASDEAGVDDL
jgi:hypothetical protein